MNTPDDLKQLQQRVYWSYHQDGLVDILFGLGVIGFGLMMLTGVVIYDILAWVPLAFYVPIKRAVTIPRYGYVEIQSGRTRRWAVISVLVGAAALFLVLGLTSLIRNDRLPAGWQVWLSSYDMLIIGALLSIPLTLISALTGLRRMLGYVGLVFAVILGGILLGIQPGLYMITLGAIILLIGAVYLGRFLSRYPIQPLGARNGS
jgi:hypothetical protein